MKKKGLKTYHSLGVILFIFCIVLGLYLYYYYERTIPFEYVTCIPKFQNCYNKGIDYAEDEKKMCFLLYDFYKKPVCQEIELKGYDSLVVSQVLRKTDFKRYDYIISYMRRITSLKYSPHLTKSRDCLYFDKRIPLIAEYEKGTYNFVYIYRIKNNSKLRAPGP